MWWRTTKRGGSSEPAETPIMPPNRSCSMRAASQMSTARPACSATIRMRSASLAGDFSAGGVLARSRARLTAWPTISPRRRLASSDAVVGSWSGGNDQGERGERVTIGLGLAETRAAGADHGPLDDRRGDGGRVLGWRQHDGDPLAGLAGQPLGRGDPGGEGRPGIEAGPRPEPHEEQPRRPRCPPARGAPSARPAYRRLPSRIGAARSSPPPSSPPGREGPRPHPRRRPR